MSRTKTILIVEERIVERSTCIDEDTNTIRIADFDMT